MKDFNEDRRGKAGRAPIDEQDTDAIVGEIEQTRAALCCTMDALQERLSPEALKEQARELMEDAGEQVRGATIGRAQHALNETQRGIRGMGGNMFDTIRNNPIPAAMVGLGLGWLWFQGQSSNKSQNWRGNYRQRRGGYGNEPWLGRRGTYDTSYGYASEGYGSEGYGSEMERDMPDRSDAGSMVNRAKESGAEVADKLQEKASDIQDKAGQVADEFGNRADRMMDEFQERGRWMASTGQGQIERILQDAPLTAGGLALAGGIALGLLIPSSEQENQWFGGMRDDVMDQMKETAQEAQEKLKRAAEEMTQEAKNETKSSATIS
jgi:ElaB/YqjD/DUF883 family membrane-anchored ribosome-binding protein